MRQLKWMPVLALALVVGCLASPALAYDRSTATVYVGYSMLRDTNLEENFTKGLVADVTFNLAESLAVPVEVSWHSKDAEIAGVNVASLSYKTYMGGLRLGGSVYTQILAGGATLDGSIVGVTAASLSKFAIQPGIGIDLPVNSKLSVRIGGDYRIIFINEDNADNIKQWRGHAGLVLGFGGY